MYDTRRIGHVLTCVCIINCDHFGNSKEQRKVHIPKHRSLSLSLSLYIYLSIEASDCAIAGHCVPFPFPPHSSSQAMLCRCEFMVSVHISDWLFFLLYLSYTSVQLARQNKIRDRNHRRKPSESLNGTHCCVQGFGNPCTVELILRKSLFSSWNILWKYFLAQSIRTWLEGCSLDWYLKNLYHEM